MTDFATLDDVDVDGKRVLVRVDLNVPVQDGKITDNTRIERVVPTLAELAERGARVVVLSHFARPKGRIVPSMSLAPLAGPLSVALKGRAVTFVPSCVGPEVRTAVASLAKSDVLLLENLRFHSGEEQNDPKFVAELAVLGEIYVSDAFSAAHRAHASTVGLATALPAVAGRLMQAELEALERALERPARPLVAVVGGVKVSSKLAVLGHLISKVDTLVVGGGMANTFLYAQGIGVGRSLCEVELADKAREILHQAESAGRKILLPIDAVTATRFAADAPRDVVAIDQVATDAMILDVGPKTLEIFDSCLSTARTVVWNGPLGAFEVSGFDEGTSRAAQAVAHRTISGELVSVAGGGDTVAALSHAGVCDDFSYVSTAGGAFLEWLEGKPLPGVNALRG
jgi:phosphoglycerate kinase